MGIKDRAVINSLKVLPHHWMSAMAGRLASLPAPTLAVKTFGRFYGVDFDEIKEPIASFGSVQSFFTRELKPGVRPIDPAADAVVSPCDGRWGAAGTITDDTAMQLKGRSYSVRMLLHDDAQAQRFAGGTYATLYLSPRDYHRFHCPLDGDVTGVRYVPGALWPVNASGLFHVDGLFTKNERIIAWLRPKHDPAQMVAMIAVGATMVGKIKLSFDDDVTTNVSQPTVTVKSYSPAIPLAKGQEWGRFEFGSTIVLLATKGAFNLNVEPPGTALKLGARIGSTGGC
ncbi:MAG: archaetidylserine decarboxylase [Deltaproteobacteria bacterium]|nr:archaetidylserine decarboxylase [Deltaproteobacteria bacterium]